MSLFLIGAVDDIDPKKAKSEFSRLYSTSRVDLVEIGNPLILTYGTNIIKLLPKGCSLDRFYLDTKLIDFPRRCIDFYIRMGFRRFSALAGLDLASMQRLRSLGESEELDIFISLMGYPNSLVRSRILQLRDIGFSKFICHGAGEQSSNAFSIVISQLKETSSIDGVHIFAAGGISQQNISIIQQTNVSGIIIGRGFATLDLTSLR